MVGGADVGDGWHWLEVELEPVDRECVGEEGEEDEVVAVMVTIQTDGLEEEKAIARRLLQVRAELMNIIPLLHGEWGLDSYLWSAAVPNSLCPHPYSSAA